MQATLLGSILMNLLFVLGCCFLVAGCRTHNLEFNAHSLTYNLAMLAIGSLGLIVPTFSAALDQWSTPDERLTLSRFVSCFLMAMSRRAAAGQAQLLANSGRRGIGRFPRKCKLRGPCGVTSGVTSGYLVHFAGA